MRMQFPNVALADANGSTVRLHDVDPRRPLIVDVLRYYG